MKNAMRLLLTLLGCAAAQGLPAADGKTVYGQTCAACHATGLAGAPKLGDRASWAPRLAAGKDSLVSAVVKGKGSMPPKAGNPSLSESDIRSAVEYMLGQVK